MQRERLEEAQMERKMEPEDGSEIVGLWDGQWKSGSIFDVQVFWTIG